ncbi:MAG: mechanosensitive ion channel domain-containing protein [Candidatus Thermoplasmatota archaeon]
MPELFVLQDFLTDASQFVRETLWVIALIILFAAIMVYALAYLSRYFEYLKMQESRYLDVGTLDFVHRVLEWVWIGILIIVIMGIASIRSAEVKVLLTEFIVRFPAILFAFVTLFVAAVLVRALRRFGAYLRGELRTKPRNLAQPRLWGITEMFLKYLILAVAILVAFVGAVDLLPDGVPEKPFLVSVRSSLTTPSSQLFLALAIAVAAAVVAFGLGRFSDSLFEDMKQRSRKHGPFLLDQFKVITRRAIYVLSLVTVLFLELGLVLNPMQLLAFAVAFLIVAFVGVLISFDAFRNWFAGLALMQADPFSVGDRVKVGDDLVGDVTAITLTLTQIRTGRGETVNLPNRAILSMPVMNFTRSEHHPIFVDVSVGWEVPHKTVEELLLEAARRTPGVLESPPPQVFGKDVGGNAIVHQLLAYTNAPEQMKQVKSALVYTIQDLFHERKIRALASVV